MELQQPLTKENFWNSMQEKYPNAMKVFCAWIDEYKAAVEWNNIFNHPDSNDYNALAYIVAPKFHDLPHAMQLGIWIEFVCQQGGCAWEIEDMFTFDLAREIAEFMESKEADLTWEKKEDADETN